MSHINPLIFREYDIRGVVDKDLTADFVEVLGRSFGTWLSNNGHNKMTLGHDCRLSSPGFTKIIARSVASCGIDVVDIGTVTTPMLYFSMFDLDIEAGLMITGSHNPKDYNGFKVCAGRAALFGSQIAEIRDIAISRQFSQGAGNITTADVKPAYFKRIVSDAALGPRRMKIVLDAGNGTGGVAVPMFEGLGIETIPLFCDMDGEFPNHHPDPTVETNLEHLKRMVVETGADVGIAYDGDADRLGVVTEKGDILHGDMVLLILARALLEEEPGATIVSEVKCSRVLFDQIAMAGGKPVMWKVGHSLIKAKMAAEQALLGGEMSGHIFYKHRWFGFDDAVYASLRLLEILSCDDTPISRLLDDVTSMSSTPEIRLDCPDDVKFKVVEAMTVLFKSRKMDVVDVDGARVDFPHGWGLVRASNTQPVLVFRFEADSDEALDSISTAVLSKAEEIKLLLTGHQPDGDQ